MTPKGWAIHQVQIQKAKASVPEDRANIMRLVEPDVTTAMALETDGCFWYFDRHSNLFHRFNMSIFWIILLIGISFGNLNGDT